MVRTDVDTRGNQCSIFEPKIVSTTGILIARSLVKHDETRNVPIRVANILDQVITLQSNSHLGKLTPVACVAGMTQRRSLSLIHICTVVSHSSKALVPVCSTALAANLIVTSVSCNQPVSYFMIS